MKRIDMASQWPDGKPLDAEERAFAEDMVRTLQTEPGKALGAIVATYSRMFLQGLALGAALGILLGALALWAVAQLLGWWQ